MVILMVITVDGDNDDDEEAQTIVRAKPHPESWHLGTVAPWRPRFLRGTMKVKDPRAAGDYLPHNAGKTRPGKELREEEEA